MRNLFILFFVLQNISCVAQNGKWKELERAFNESQKVCKPCIDDFSEEKIGYLMNALNRDFSTSIFDSLKYSKQIAFSRCKNNYQEKGYLDCFYINKLIAANKSTAAKIFDYLSNIDEKTIYYNPPQYWSWYLLEDKIYFLYSNTYAKDSDEFLEVKGIMDMIFLSDYDDSN